ncbi:hypothetical protein AGMMS49587_20250 [Spirochaetia bacterium]|nr:hypothetical protein AGMMS49587_20250 [Spirochaetia bacterium]
MWAEDYYIDLTPKQSQTITTIFKDANTLQDIGRIIKRHFNYESHPRSIREAMLDINTTLQTRQGNCADLTLLYFLGCRSKGWKVEIVTGDINGGSHFWNKVQINGTWYFSDITAYNVGWESNGVPFNPGPVNWINGFEYVERDNDAYTTWLTGGK